MFNFKFSPEVQWHLDFDGTLFHTHTALLAAYETAILEHGGIFTSDAKNALVRGESFGQFLSMCLWNSSEPDYFRIRARKNEIYLSNIHLIQPNTKLIEMALSLLPNISIVTSSNKFAVVRILESFNLSNSFVNIVSADDVNKTKPNPEPYIKSISRAPESIHVAIEDSELGIIAAKAAGLLVLRTTDIISGH